MGKIFIDAGANDGCSVLKFRTQVDTNCEYHIYSFEVDPDFKYNFNDIPNLTFINKAVWIEDGKKEFYRDFDKNRYSGTLIKKKRSGDLNKDNPLIVDTIDFSNWVRTTLSKDDFIILKMDIEGAEYYVIPKMMDDGTFDYINELWIEWHWSKIKLPQERHNELVAKITIPIIKWDAIRWSKNYGK